MAGSNVDGTYSVVTLSSENDEERKGKSKGVRRIGKSKKRIIRSNRKKNTSRCAFALRAAVVKDAS